MTTPNPLLNETKLETIAWCSCVRDYLDVKLEAGADVTIVIDGTRYRADNATTPAALLHNQAHVAQLRGFTSRWGDFAGRFVYRLQYLLYHFRYGFKYNPLEVAARVAAEKGSSATPPPAAQV